MKKLMVLLLVVGLCLSQAPAFAATPVVKVDGSSTVFPITEAVAEEFQKSGGGAKVMVGISGTGGGFKRFCRGETDISDASRPIKKSEISLCIEGNIQYVELPVAYDGLTVIINPKNTWVDHLTVAELKKIWSPGAQGTITNWNQVREGFPDEPLVLFGPGTDSGTFDYFTEAVNGKAGDSRGDYTASEDDNVLVEGVASDRGALGYFGLAYYEQNKDKLKVVPVDGGDGPVTPSVETVMDSTYKPLARPIFIYVSKKSLQEKDYVKKFVEYYLENAAPLVEEVGYIPLQAESYEAALARLQSGIVGSVFGNKATAGMSMVSLLRMEK